MRSKEIEGSEERESRGNYEMKRRGSRMVLGSRKEGGRDGEVGKGGEGYILGREGKGIYWEVRKNEVRGSRKK